MQVQMSTKILQNTGKKHCTFFCKVMSKKIVLMLMKQVYFTSYCQQNLQHKSETMTWWQKYQTMPHCNSNGSEKLKPSVIIKHGDSSMWMRRHELYQWHKYLSISWNNSIQQWGIVGGKSIHVQCFHQQHHFLRTVKTAFLPANCINMLQFLWSTSSIIKCMKIRYRKALVLKTTAALDRKTELNLNVLHRLYIL